MLAEVAPLGVYPGASPGGTLDQVGQLIYGEGTAYDMDDRTMSHVRVAIGARLRRREAFYLSWTNPHNIASGRVSLWLSPSIPLQFRFNGSRPVELNPEWLRALDASTLNEGGMIVMPESEASAYVPVLEAAR